MMQQPPLNTIPSPQSNKKGWPWSKEIKQLPDTMPDGRPWPRISIVTPSFNQGSFIEETIRSVLLQGYPNLEYIVIDGGSTDQTVEVLKKYEPWLTYWVSEKDRGQSHAINKGFARASGVVGNWLNSDDYLCPNSLLSIACAVPKEKCGKFVIAAGGEIIDGKGEVLKEVSISPQPAGWPFSFSLALKGGVQPAYFFSLQLFREAGGVDPTLYYVMDTDLFNRFGLLGYQSVMVPERVAKFRVHDGAKTHKFPHRMTFEKLQLYRKYCEVESESAQNAMLHISQRIFQSDFSNAPIKIRLYALLFVLRNAPKLFLNKKKLRQVVRLFFV